MSRLIPAVLKSNHSENVGFAKVSLKFRPTFVTRLQVCGYGAGRKEDCKDLAAEDPRTTITPSQRHSMKRTRRIEITRYRRTVTQRNGPERVSGRAEELTVIETAVNEWDISPEGDHPDSDRLVTRVVPPEVKLTRTAFNFRRWLRQKFRGSAYWERGRPRPQ